MQILILCLIVIILIVLILSYIAINLSYIKTNKKLFQIETKIDSKLAQIEVQNEHIKAFILPTYNNSIRIAKKLNVYYCLNKEDYEENKKIKS